MDANCNVELANPCMWKPRIAGEPSLLRRLMHNIESKFKCYFKDDYWLFHKWTCVNYPEFWEEFLKFSDIIYSGDYSEVIDRSRPMDTIPKWFVGTSLNYAENILAKGSGDKVALYFAGEKSAVIDKMTFDQLRRAVYQYAVALKKLGVSSDDRVVGYMPNCLECVVAMLATAAVGATWSSASPDFGVLGVVERFVQVQPKVLFSVEAVHYNQKRHEHLDKLRRVVQQLPTVESVVVVPFIDDGSKIDISTIPKSILLADFLRQSEDTTTTTADDSPAVNGSFQFQRVPFDHPLFIMFSSGTTGAPKCMCHSVGGTLLKHMEEHMLQANVNANDVMLFYSTAGWMMWNWLVSALATGASVVLYDGSPFLPHCAVLFDLVDQLGITILGMGAKCFSVMHDNNVKPCETHSLTTLRCVLSTGSPLKPQSFDYIFKSIKADVLVGSISGGTDIIACFMGVCCLLPVHRGEVQAPYLGCEMACWDEEGNALSGERGELVCTKPFPSMPTHFIGDIDGSRYRRAYFDKFPGVWAHGDYCILNPLTGGIIMLGRSDGTLNPGGVRFGSSEIYQVVEGFTEIADSVCVGQRVEADERVVLFVKLRPGYEFTPDLVARLRTSIRLELSARHVPAVIAPIADIPYTSSGKKVEVAVKKILSGEVVTNREALANPECLDLFTNILELKV